MNIEERTNTIKYLEGLNPPGNISHIIKKIINDLKYPTLEDVSDDLGTKFKMCGKTYALTEEPSGYNPYLINLETFELISYFDFDETTSVEIIF